MNEAIKNFTIYNKDGTKSKEQYIKDLDQEIDKLSKQIKESL